MRLSEQSRGWLVDSAEDTDSSHSAAAPGLSATLCRVDRATRSSLYQGLRRRIEGGQDCWGWERTFSQFSQRWYNSYSKSAQNVGAASALPVACPPLYWFGAAVCGPDPGWADGSFFLPAALWDWSRTGAAAEEEPGWDWATARVRRLRALNSMLRRDRWKEEVMGMWKSTINTCGSEEQLAPISASGSFHIDSIKARLAFSASRHGNTRLCHWVGIRVKENTLICFQCWLGLEHKARSIMTCRCHRWPCPQPRRTPEMNRARLTGPNKCSTDGCKSEILSKTLLPRLSSRLCWPDGASRRSKATPTINSSNGKS